MELTVKQLDQIIKIFKRGKWELDGEEILAVASCINTLSAVVNHKIKEASNITNQKKDPIKLSEPKKKIKS